MLADEHKIIREAKKGNAGSFGVLYDHYIPQIYRFIFMKVSHKQEAEDLAHEVFLSAWQNIDNFDYIGHPFSSWLYQIARNRIIDHYRTRKETVTLESVSEDEFEISDALEQRLDQKKEMVKVKEAIQQLNDDQQNIIILRYIEDLGPDEIAEIINKSEGAVRLMQHRAIQNLKKILNNDGEPIA